jgi:hypothetical protein
MTNPNLTHIFVLRDRSYSMNSIKEQTDSGFDEFIAAQREVDGECLVTLVDFDDQYEVVYARKPLNEVPPSNLQPRGNTALHDSLGKLIEDAGRELASLPEDKRPGSVIFVVLTDGEQNAHLGNPRRNGIFYPQNNWYSPSVETATYKLYTASQLRELIKRQQDVYSWNFYFLGANQDAVLVGGDLGFYASNSLTYTGQNTGAAFAATATSTANYRTNVMRGISHGEAVIAAAFTDEDRTAATE